MLYCCLTWRFTLVWFKNSLNYGLGLFGLYSLALMQIVYNVHFWSVAVPKRTVWTVCSLSWFVIVCRKCPTKPNWSASSILSDLCAASSLLLICATLIMCPLKYFLLQILAMCSFSYALHLHCAPFNLSSLKYMLPWYSLVQIYVETMCSF